MSETISNTSQAYNLVWITPRSPFDFKVLEGEQFRQPIPDHTADNILDIAGRHPNTDVLLWVDPFRLTGPQKRWMEALVGRSGNMSLKDLRKIPEYAGTPLFNSSDYSPYWRYDKNSLIWRQVDAARILVSLQGDYDQVFYSDTDVIGLDINSDQIQSRMRKHGVVISGLLHETSVGYENNMFGFDKTRKESFRLLYGQTLKFLEQAPVLSAYDAYISWVNSELKERAGIDTREIIFQCQYEGLGALPPGIPILSPPEPFAGSGRPLDKKGIII